MAVKKSKITTSKVVKRATMSVPSKGWISPKNAMNIVEDNIKCVRGEFTKKINEVEDKIDIVEEKIAIVDEKIAIVDEKIAIVDERDKQQFSLAKDHIKKYDVILSNQEYLKTNQSDLQLQMVKLEERQKRVYEDFVPELNEGIKGIYSMIDTHITDEAQEFNKINGRLDSAVLQVSEIKDTLDNVSANGNKGLSASFTDVYNKLNELEKLTFGVRARARFWKLAHDMIDNTPLLKPLKYKMGAVIYIIIILLIVNTVFHALGWEFNVISIIQTMLSWLKGQ